MESESFKAFNELLTELETTIMTIRKTLQSLEKATKENSEDISIIESRLDNLEARLNK